RKLIQPGVCNNFFIRHHFLLTSFAIDGLPLTGSSPRTRAATFICRIKSLRYVARKSLTSSENISPKGDSLRVDRRDDLRVIVKAPPLQLPEISFKCDNAAPLPLLDAEAVLKL